MSAVDLVLLLRARPFRPFRLCMSDATLYEVRHPDLVITDLTTAIVGYPSLEHPGAAARFDLVSLSHIVRIEFLDVPEAAQASNS